MVASPLITHCPTCGAETRDGARFCYQCGAGLQPDAVPMPALLTAPPLPMALLPPPSSGAPSGSITPMMPPAFPPPYGYPLVAHPVPRSRMATAGFCLGLVAVTIGIALTWLGTIIGVCGLIFSMIGLGETSARTRHPAGPRTGRAFAIAGAILSVLGIIGSVVLLVYILQNAERFGIQLPRTVGR